MKQTQKYLVAILILGILGFSLQSAIISNEYLVPFGWGPLMLAYLLFGGLTFAVLVLIDYISKNFEDMFGKAFLASTFLKMLVALGFLLFLINDFPKMPKSVAINLLIPYLIFLFYEVFWALKALKTKDI